MQDLERNFTPQEDAGQELQLLIKNPAKDASSDFGLSVAFESTLGHVKQQIQKDYAGSPPPEAQTLIYGGKVLKNDQQLLKDILRRAQDTEGPHTLHLVVKPPPARFSSDLPRRPLQTTLPRAGSTPTVPPVASASNGTEQGPFSFHSTAGPSNQAPEVAHGNPFPQNPALAAAYNAAFAALSNHSTGFPDLSQLPPGSVPIALGGQLGPGPPTSDQQGRPVVMNHYPTFSIPVPNAAVPSMVPYPAYMPQQAAPAPAPAPAPASSEGTSSAASTSTAGPSTAATHSSAQAGSSSSNSGASTSQTQAPASQPFFAPPAFAYVPVSLVSSVPVASQQQQPGQHPGAQQMPIGAMSYPLQPILPVAVPYGVYHPYPAPTVLPPQAGHMQQQQQQQQYAGQQLQQQYNAAQMQQQYNAAQMQGQFHPAGGFPPMAGPHFGVAMVRHPGGAQPAQIAQAVAQAAAAGHMGAMGPAAAVPAGQPRRQIRVRLLRINLRVALQLMVLAGILYQHCPPGRFFLIMGVATLFYVAGFAPFRQAMHRILGVEAPAAGNARPAGNPPGAGAAHAAPAGILHELHALIVGFFASLLPGWNLNPEDAAAFAAAQQVGADGGGEGAAGNINAGNPAGGPPPDRPHQD